MKVKCPLPGCEYETIESDDNAVIAALLNIHASTHTVTTQTAKPDKLRRPTVSSAGTSAEWEYFMTRWKEYRDGTKLTGSDCVSQLLECCDEDLRRDLTRAAGGSLAKKSEQDVLEAIKALAVRKQNTMVARTALNSMRQDRDEAVRSFVARIKGQASICKFVLKCPSCSTDEQI